MSLQQARRLRRTMTDAERRLWSRLRDRQLHGYKFRRQHPLGPYVLDFFCEQENLVIEVDGGQHALDKERDARRTRWLQAHGCRVLRFWNNDVLQNTDGILATIATALKKPGEKAPLPGGEGLG